MQAKYKIGQVVGFKSDIEQYGTIVEIRRSRTLGGHIDYIVEADDKFIGEYIGGMKRAAIYEDQIFEAPNQAAGHDPVSAPMDQEDREKLVRLILRETKREVEQFEQDLIEDHGKGEF